MNPKSTLQLLASIEGANGVLLLQELDDTRREAVQAVRSTGRKAKIVLTLEIEPTKFNRGKALGFKGKINAQIPNKPGEATLLFDDEQGNVYDNDPDPKQTEDLFPRAVPDKTGTA